MDFSSWYCSWLHGIVLGSAVQSLETFCVLFISFICAPPAVRHAGERLGSCSSGVKGSAAKYLHYQPWIQSGDLLPTVTGIQPVELPASHHVFRRKKSIAFITRQYIYIMMEACSSVNQAQSLRDGASLSSVFLIQSHRGRALTRHVRDPFLRALCSVYIPLAADLIKSRLCVKDGPWECAPLPNWAPLACTSHLAIGVRLDMPSGL